MGFNSVVLVLNDRLNEIWQTPDRFVHGMIDAIHASSAGRQEEFIGQSEVIGCEHADVVQIIAVGGNCATVLGKFGNGGRHHQEEDQIQLLRWLAEEYGFTLRKKPERRGNGQGAP